MGRIECHCCRESGRLVRRFCGLSLRRSALVHRHRQIHRPTGDRRPHVGGIRELEAEQAEQPPHPLIVDVDTIVQVVQHAARLGVEPHVPHPLVVVDAALRHDAHVDGEEVRDPLLEHAAQRLERRLAAVQADRQVVALVAVPVVVGVLGATARRGRPSVSAPIACATARRGCRSPRSSRRARRFRRRPPSPCHPPARRSSAAGTASRRRAPRSDRPRSPRMWRSRICVS